MYTDLHLLEEPAGGLGVPDAAAGLHQRVVVDDRGTEALLLFFFGVSYVHVSVGACVCFLCWGGVDVYVSVSV